MNYSEISKKIRLNILEMCYKAREAHIGSALSCVDILNVLYSKILSINSKSCWYKNRDLFILSKGHAVAALYATLAEKGFFSKEKLNEYCMNGSKMAGHSTKKCLPGVEISTGSLGHGLSMGNGMAIASKNRVFVLLSDGECDEGATWEAALFAGHHKLSNLTAIIDYNKWQAFGKIKEILTLEPLADKWKSFGWATKEVNGHNFLELERVLSSIPFEKEKPSLIIAHTIKGKGISFLEDNLESHYKHFSEEEYNLAKQELKK